MDPSYYDFDTVKRKIKEIKKKNIILCKQLKRSGLCNYSLPSIKESASNKRESEMFDKLEVSAVEYCYQKATELAEYYLKLRKAKKQKKSKLEIIHKLVENNLDAQTITCNTSLDVETCKVSNSHAKNSVNVSLMKQCNTNKEENKVVASLNGKEHFVASYCSNNCLSQSNTSKKEHFQPSYHIDGCPFAKSNAANFNLQFVPDTVFQKGMQRKSNNLSTVKENNKKVIYFSDFVHETLERSEPKKKLSKNASNCIKVTNTKCSISANSDQDVICLENESYICGKKKAYLSGIEVDKVQNVNKNKLRVKIKKSKNKIKQESNKRSQIIPKSVNHLNPLISNADETHIQNRTYVDTSLLKTSKFSNLKESIQMIVPEIDLTNDCDENFIPELIKESSETVIPELNLAEDTVIKSDLNLIEKPVEVIVPELDLTEEPVSFPVPLIHMEASIESEKKKLESLKQKGVVIKTGKWSKREKALLERNFKNFQSQFGIYDSNLLLGIGRRLHYNKYENYQILKFLRAKHFYLRLGKDINERTLRSIYFKARNTLNPFRKQKDCTSSDIVKLLELQKKYGNNWILIGQRLGLYSRDCCNIYLYNKKPYAKGKWSGYEIKKLISAIKSVTNRSELTDESLKGISWRKIAELVPTRNPNQCFLEWKNNQSKLQKKISFQKWDISHAAKLIFLLKNKYFVIDESYVNWKEIFKCFTNVTHNEYALKRRWNYIKRCIPQKYKGTFSEIIDFCCLKYSKYINAFDDVK